jgi:urease accessory protein
MQVLVDLPRTTSLAHGDALCTSTGVLIEIVAAPEPLLQVTGGDLTRIAWHIGNRHTPCQIEAGRLLIQRDHVMADLLSRIGATVADVTEPFTPEGGAYGHGRTHGHDHTHTHGPDNGHAVEHHHEH